MTKKRVLRSKSESQIAGTRHTDACLMPAHHVWLCDAFSCITCDRLISAKGWRASDFSTYALHLPSPTTVSRGKKRYLCTNQEEVHGHGRHLQLATHTRINRRCSASRPEPAESDSIPLCCSVCIPSPHGCWRHNCCPRQQLDNDSDGQRQPSD